jgi:hypothetical protein
LATAPLPRKPIYKEPSSSHTIGAFQPNANDCNDYSINPAADFDANLCVAAEKQMMSSEMASEEKACGWRLALNY